MLFFIFKDGEHVFGGLQIIVVGDFLQLRPVKNMMYNDPGYPCYKSPAWKAAVTHVVVLKEVLRQDEPALVKVLQYYKLFVNLTLYLKGFFLRACT